MFRSCVMSAERRRGCAGISVVEVFFAILLLAVALSGAYLMVTQCTRLLLAARDHYVATTLCLARIERARNVDYPLLDLLEEGPPGLLVNQDGAPDETGLFRRQSSVLINSPAAGTTTLEVTVFVRNRRTGEFGQACERMSCIFTKYLNPDGT